MWKVLLLWLAVAVPLAFGHDYIGDKYLKEACHEATEEVSYSFRETRTLFAPHEEEGSTFFGSEADSLTQTTTKTTDNQLQKLRFPSKEAEMLARAEEIKEITLEKIFTLLRQNGEISEEEQVEEDTCAVEKEDRLDCGYDGITLAECIRKGCCFGADGECYWRKTHIVFKVLSPTARKNLSELSGCHNVREDPDCSDWCYHKKYRTIDGTCNNLKNPTWGATLTPLKRIIPAEYENSFSTPRGWVPGFKHNGFEVPPARKVSTSVLSANEIVKDSQYSYMLMQWGQFVDHDTDKVPTNPSTYGFKTGLPCSKNPNNENPCFPLPIPEDDHRIKNKTHLGFTRSASICSGSLFGVRQQMNEITSYLDSSNVYGSTVAENEALRDPEDRAYLGHGYEYAPGKFFLPLDVDGKFMGCEIDPAVDEPCFLAGDKRANEQLGLTMIHTVWHREHNRIVDELKKINPHWDSETLYQEARSITNAQYQHITYHEWLPKVIGERGIEQMGEYTGPDQTVDASISNNFSGASFRMGHAMILPFIPRLNPNYKECSYGNLELHKGFFQPHLFKKEGGLDPVIRGWIHTPAKMTSPKAILNLELVERLFELAKNIALDLGALNIQRGRDHGLPPYTRFRDFCGLPAVADWSDLESEISSPEVLLKLKETYGHYDNIDLFAGALCEDNLPDSRLGPTFTCLVGEQFRRLRDGDRFFYRNTQMFTAKQIAEIQKSTFARVLCDNSDGSIKVIQKDVFRLAEYPAGFTECGNIPSIDLWAWKEKQDAGTCPGTPSTSQPEDTNSDGAPTCGTAQLCCCGKVYGSSYDPIDLKKFRCCGEIAYDPNVDACCNGRLNCGKPESTHACCAGKAFNPLDVTCIDGIITESRIFICDEQKFDPATEICCAGKINVRNSHVTTCCGDKAYDPTIALCCRGIVWELRDPYHQCCGPDHYDPRSEICCDSGDVEARPDTQFGTTRDYTIDFSTDSDTDPTTDGDSDSYNHFDWFKYDTWSARKKRSLFYYWDNTYSFDWGSYGQDSTSTQIQCCGQPLAENKDFTSYDSCCRGTPYNWRYHICCDGKLHLFKTISAYKCCGTAAYRLDQQTCCDTGAGLEVFEGVGSCPVGDSHRCRGEAYDPETHICCQGYLFPAGPNVGCCGRYSYNQETEICCQNEQCRKKVYNKTEPGDCTVS